MSQGKWLTRARNYLSKYSLRISSKSSEEALTIPTTESTPASVKGAKDLDEIKTYFRVEKPTAFAPLSIQWKDEEAMMLEEEEKKKIASQQATNRESTWSESQQPRSVAMSGPRFTQIDYSKQPIPMSAQAFVDSDPVIMVSERKVMCDGGGPLGHPRVYINLDKEGKPMPCMYCGKRFLQAPH